MKRSRKVALTLLLAVLCITAASGNTLSDTLYINRTTDSLASLLFHRAAFNPTPMFLPGSQEFALELTDTLSLVVVNLDSVPHTFTVDGVLESNNSISAGATAQFQLHFTQPGTYQYYSDVPQGRLLGASGIILVGYQQHHRFFWNLDDMESTLSAELATGVTTTMPADYQPEAFTINGLAHPETLTDSTAVVAVSVGDTVVIAIANGGPMTHSLHFHGYHVTILQSSHTPNTVGWIKDTFPVLPGARLTVLLVPNQPGEYPVHDHNLIAVTNAGFYPGGMIAHLSIAP